MHSTTRPTITIAWFGALLLGLGCASAGSPADADSTSSAGSEPKTQAELSLQEPSAPSLAAIYFDTNQALLREDARETLKGEAQAIRQHPDWGVVTIAGHCDERGSEEYNLALGARRAQAVERYLADLGVSRSRLETRTYGEMRPAVVGHDEAAWRLNRRAELESEAPQSARR